MPEVGETSIRSQHNVFPREGFRLSERNEGFRPFREAFIQRTWKQSESLVLRVVLYEEFLHTKINNKDVYVDYGATEDIQTMRAVQAVWMEIGQHWTEVGD